MPKRLIAKFLPKGGLGRAIAMMAGGTALGQLASIASLPILSRLYEKESFGVVNSYTSILSNLAIISGLRYEQAVPISEDDREAADALGLAGLSTVLLSLLVGIVLLIFGRPILHTLKAEELYGYSWVIPLGVFLRGMNQTISFWATRRRAFGSLAKRRAHQGIFTALFQIGLFYVTKGSLGLVLGFGLGQGSGMGSLLRDAWKNDRELFRGITFAGMKRVGKRYGKFPLISGPAAFCNSLALNLPGLLMPIYFGMAANGDLRQANQVMALPLSLVGAAAGQAFLGEAPKLLRDDPAGAKKLFDKLTSRLAKFSVFVVLGGILAIWLAPIVLGAKWQEAGIYMAILGLPSALQFVTSPISQITSILERQDLQFAGDAGRAVLTFGAFYGAYRISDDPRTAIIVYAITMVVTYAGFFAMYRALLMNAVKRRLAGENVAIESEEALDPESPQE